MPRLAGKKAVVTGASSGIGRGIALAYAAEGADLVISYNRSAERAAAVVEELRAHGVRATAIQADLADPAAIDRLIGSARDTLGRLDIWVNNAGADILTGAAAEEPDTVKLQRLIEVDLKGTIACCWALAPVMEAQGGGAIINMSWDLCLHGFEGRNPQMFAAVKAGVLGFSRSFARSHAPKLRVNVLGPGWIETAFAEQDMDADYYRARTAEIPVGRFGRPEDVAEAAVFLGSDESAYITGEMIRINGGLV